jgi:hypothetical protein
MNNFTELNMFNVVAVPEQNFSRLASGVSIDDCDELIQSLLHGYNSAMGVMIAEKTALDKSQCDLLFDNREAFFHDLGNRTFSYNLVIESETTTDVKKKQMLVSGFEVENYLKASRKKAKKCEYQVVSGHRRFLVWPIVCALQAKYADILPLSDKLPFDIREYVSDEARKIDILAENVRKSIGSKAISEADKIQSAYELRSNGAKEIVIRHLYKDGYGQKLTALSDLLLSLNAEGSITVEDFCSRVMSKTYKFSAFKTAELKGLTGKSWDEIEQYFINPAPDSKNKAKIMDKSGIEVLSKSNIRFFNEAIKGILDNNPACLASYNKDAKLLNDLYEAWQDVEKKKKIVELLMSFE